MAKKKICIYLNGEYVCTTEQHNRCKDVLDEIKKAGEITYIGLLENGATGFVRIPIGESDKVTAHFIK